MSQVAPQDVQAQWPDLLDRVARGETITIVESGRAVAVLGPPGEAPGPRAALEEMRVLRRGNRLAGLGLRDLIDEGRLAPEA